MTDIETGRAWLAVVIIAAVVTTALFGVRSLGGLAATLVLSLIGLVPSALIGHSASSADHEGAINSLGLHLVGVSAWVGGIIMLALLSGMLGATRPARRPAAARTSPNRHCAGSPPWPGSPSSSSSPPASSMPASASPPGTTSSAPPTGS